MKKSFAITLILLLTLPELLAQSETRVIPPSPESSSVFKFLEVPVSTFTGIPNISVPLYEIKLKQLALPIQLGYHARGIRVEEIAPRVGLGWALSYGGMISRQIRDKADDHTNGYLDQDYYNTVFTDGNARAAMYNDIVNYNIDMVPDQFFFDMNGTGGKFVFDQVSGGILQQQYSDNKITPIMGSEGIEGWVGTDTRGNTYYYGLSKDGLREAVDYDVLINSYVYSWLNGPAVLGNDGDDRAINTWHLMEIETPFNERIEFFYEEEVSTSYRRSYDKKVQSDVLCYFSHTQTHQQQIKDIVFANGKVSFTKSSVARQDLTNAYVLDKLSVYNKQNELIKQYQLQFHYTTSPDDANQLDHLKNIDPKSNKRLFLSSIQESGKSGQTIPPYQFQYNETLLPNRFSNAQDKWGYYNGKPNGQFLTFMNYNNNPINREVDVALSEAGLLTMITYPTGGSVKFNYEHNTASYPPFMGELLYPLYIENEVDVILDGFLQNPMYYNGSFYSDTITIGPAKTGLVEFEFDLQGCTGDPLNDPAYCNDYNVRLKNGTINLYLYPPNITKTLDLDTGTWILNVIPNDSNHDPYDLQNAFYVTLSWSEIVTDSIGGPPGSGSEAVMAAGKRIKKIEYLNADSTVITKEYNYMYPDSSGTSGKIFGLPNYYYKQEIVNNVTFIDPYGSLPGSPLSNIQGNSVGYGYVTEYMGTSTGNQGKTEYEFTTTEDGGDYYTFPYHLPMDNEWLRGKVRETKIFEKTSSGTYSLKKKIENTYQYAGDYLFPLFYQFPDLFSGGTDFVHSKTSTNFFLPLLTFTSESGGYKVYHLSGGTFNLQSSRETYYEQDVARLQKLTKYTYQYDHHYQVSSIENSLSDGSSEVTMTSYPGDYPVGTAFIDSMKSKNLLAYPIEVVKYKRLGSTVSVLSGTINQYNTANPALLTQVLSLENEDPLALSSFKFSNRSTGILPPQGSPSLFAPHDDYETVLTYDEYDSKGNILQYHKNADMQVSYVWDYNAEFPIAEAKNALLQDIAFTSFEADGKGYWNFAGTPVTDTSAPTGLRVYNLASGGITKGTLNSSIKYLLTYWAKSTTSPGVTGTGSTPEISPPTVLATLNGWTKFQRTLSNISSISITGSVPVDEIRLHPAHAQMTTYTYDPLVGMSSASDENANTTYFKYDNLNRLEYVKDLKKNIVKQYQYNYSEE